MQAKNKSQILVYKRKSQPFLTIFEEFKHLRETIAFLESINKPMGWLLSKASKQPFSRPYSTSS